MLEDKQDFLSLYLAYTANTEPPAIYHRWSILTALSAYIGRTYYLKHGHFNIYPNLYTILIGNAGSRKNTAINIAKKILRLTGYNTIAATKTTKEKFFIDMAEQLTLNTTIDDILDQTVNGALDTDMACEMFIGAGEFNTFFGNNILDFLSDLGELWDYEGNFESKIKNGKSIIIPNPTISILGGNTPTTFANAFPPEIIGQGFFSRTVLVYGERTRDKITFPEEPPTSLTEELVARLSKARSPYKVEVGYTPGAKKLLDKIYHAPELIEDSRFESFYNRRLTTLLKLCLILTVIGEGRNITEQVVIYANTILTHVEQLMPKALGEFGKSKNSDISHKVMQLVYNSPGIVTIRDIWAAVYTDLEQMKDLAVILNNLQEAGKIQAIPGKGFLPHKRVLDEGVKGLVDFNLLTSEEVAMKK